MRDQTLLDAVFDAATPLIEEMVTKELHKGRLIGEMAIVLERRSGGRARMRCTDRANLLRALEADPKLGPNVCQQIAESIGAAKANQIPVVALLYEGDGVAGGVRLITGIDAGLN